MNPLSLVLLLLAIQASPVEGPISDMIGSRVDKLAARVEAWKTESENAQQTRFSEVMQAIAEARQERKTLLDSMQKLVSERDGFFDQMQTMRQEMKVQREENGTIFQRVAKSVQETMAKEWTPFKAIVERIEALVWSLFKLFIALCILVVAVASVVLFLYVRLKSRLLTLAQGKIL